MTVQDQESKQGTKRQTLKLLAQIGKQQVLILVDSGSIGTFISDRLVTTLKLPVQPCAQANFKVADGGQLQCTEQVSNLHWWIQGHTFTSDARVLALRCYDMIVGEDWLEAVSLVWVDYKTKEMRITHRGQRITLHGVCEQLDQCPEISRKKLQGLIRNGGVAYCIQLDSAVPSEVVSDEL
jgi:hypothetical protein